MIQVTSDECTGPGLLLVVVVFVLFMVVTIPRDNNKKEPQKMSIFVSSDLKIKL